MLWAAHCLSFFGFCCKAEFTTNPRFDSSIHLAVSNVQADVLVDPTCLKIHTKCSKDRSLSDGLNHRCGPRQLCYLPSGGHQ